MQHSDISPDRLGICQVCHSTFEQPEGAGRKRIYCSRACQQKQFRHALSVTKLNDQQRQALVQQHKAIGDWRFTSLPEWPKYRCLA